MKKIVSAVLIVVMLVGATAMLASCGESDVPHGMQLVRGGDSVGYYLYAPEEWTVANQESLGISAAYVSKLDNTSVTMIEAELPTATVPEYIATELKKYPESFELAVTLEPREASFGNAESAYKVVYTYKYDSFEYQSMQIFAIYKSHFYIFTYNASTAQYTADDNYYTNYLEKIEEVMANVKFVDKVDAPEVNTEFPKDGDGYSLVSDKVIAGFDMYIPESYKLDWASAMVSATNAKGANVTVSKATDTNVNDNGYWNTRFKQLERIATSVKYEYVKNEAGEITVDQAGEKMLAGKKGVDLGEGLDAVSIEYSYELFGESYSVYQVLIVDGYTGYVFTFTAKTADYAELLPEAQTILYKLKF
jgi:hypothetical protein